MKKWICLLLPFLVLGAACAEEPVTPKLHFRCLDSAGYTWSMELSDQTLLEVREELEAPEEDNESTGNDSALVSSVTVHNDGAESAILYTLIGLKPGTGTLTMTYGRPWEETGDKTVMTYTFLVDKELNVILTEQTYSTH